MIPVRSGVSRLLVIATLLFVCVPSAGAQQAAPDNGARRSIAALRLAYGESMAVPERTSR